MLRVAKLFPFGGEVIEHKFVSTTLIAGVIGDGCLPLTCYVLLHICCSRVAKLIPSTVDIYIYIYIYIGREKERERERWRDRDIDREIER